MSVPIYSGKNESPRGYFICRGFISLSVPMDSQSLHPLQPLHTPPIRLLLSGDRSCMQFGTDSTLGDCGNTRTRRTYTSRLSGRSILLLCRDDGNKVGPMNNTPMLVRY
jgi:hypothetical protein